jgi:hypothetical protein
MEKPIKLFKGEMIMEKFMNVLKKPIVWILALILAIMGGIITLILKRK